MELNKYIEHTNLNNTAKLKDIEKLCNEAIKYKFSAVCVYPYYVHLAHELLKDTNIEVIIPPIWCTTDNAAMIAKVASYLYDRKIFASLDLSVNPSWKIQDYLNF